MKEGRVS